ncbi:MMPL family transporter [Roseomonas terrae]|jgi:predicted exporter|uniref:MMPL family transporter n=1 Tax=Neoroseomonas terrae TaxID=424799 RepID=A0ABS5EPD7_9PROT|nr:MMPL family transporter [Neoroseomonas terrae]MBR0652883.1 MMPL family transporter [Neoroseomonas terrae]
MTRLLGFLPLLLALAVLSAAFPLALREVTLRSDIADFLPQSRTPEAAFLLRELRDGAATRLLIAGVEGAPAAELAQVSRSMAETLRGSGLFAVVANGVPLLSDAEIDLLFAHRYALSPTTTPNAFTEAALRASFETQLDGLRSSAERIFRRFGFADPTGSFLGLVRGWSSASRVTTENGVWMAAGPRALILAETRAAGLDITAQQTAVDAFRHAFQTAGPPEGARLLVSGPGVFAAEAAAAVRADVKLVSTLSFVLVAAFLLWRYRSPMMLAVVAVPLALGTLAGLLVVDLTFGHVHGAALGFGMTMLGVSDDYPILLVTNRAPGEALRDTARRIWPTLRLAVAAAVAGLVPMLASGFPGLAQLGLFAATGLAVSALATRFLLPALLRAEGLPVRPLPERAAHLLLRLPSLRVPVLAGLVLVAVALALSGGPRLARDIAELSPVPEPVRMLDGELRAQIGAPDVRVLLSVEGPNAEAALRASEQAAAALLAAGVVTGVDHPARYLPSIETQRARLALLPDDATLAARVEAARTDLPFRATAFQPFLTGVAEARGLPPLTPGGLVEAPLLAARLSPLLREEGGRWRALLLPEGVGDPTALRAAAAGVPGLMLVDIKGETEALLDQGIGTALRWGAVGGVLVLLLLGAGRGVAGALRIALSLAGALLLTFAALHALGERITVFHLTAALLLAGVGMDYALFVSRTGREDIEDAARALGAVITCMITTLLTFGLLALCRTPVLHATGLTVCIGVASAFLLACTLAPRR